jgi:putative endonuclease
VFFVYVLQSQSTGKHYVGQTQDLAARISQHNDPTRSKTKFTAKDPGPWIVIHQEEHSTRSEAMRRERWLKSGVGREWLERQLAQSAEYHTAATNPNA